MQVSDLGQVEALDSEVKRWLAEVTRLHDEARVNPTNDKILAVKTAVVHLLKASHNYHSKIVTLLDGDWQPLP